MSDFLVVISRRENLSPIADLAIRFFYEDTSESFHETINLNFGLNRS